MSKIATLTLLAAATLGAGAALASERAPVEPTAPSFIRELGRAETATVGGTVVELRGEDFVLADPEDGRLRVDADHLRLEGLTLGEMVTVTGRLDDGEFEAGHIIREDGSVVVRGASHDEDEEERS